MFQLVDANAEEMDRQFDILADRILAQAQRLGNKTGIGTLNKFKADGIAWKYLREIVFKLIDEGVIKKIQSQGMTKVDLCGLEEIEVRHFIELIICLDQT